MRGKRLLNPSLKGTSYRRFGLLIVCRKAKEQSSSQNCIPNFINTIFRKGTDPNIDSYSAFFDNQKLKSTGLDGYLKGLSIDELHFAGLAADYCVYYSRWMRLT